MPEISQILRKGVLCDLKDTVARKLLDRKYTLPALGIPMTDLSRDVRTAIANAGAVYDIVSSIPSWALKPNKPTYTAQEVGALPSSTVIPTVPTKLSAFINDVGYVTSFEESDPTVPQWAKQQTKPSYTASEVGALPSTTHIPTDPVNADWNASSGLARILNKPTLFSGDYNDLRNKPVIPESVDLTGYATTDDVDAAIAALVSSAPQTLDTLKELADALGDDPNFATTVSTALGNKVDKVSGKVLSSNDYTTADKNKLAGIAEGAEVNVNADWNATSGDARILNKPSLFSGNYNDLINKPTIPAAYNDTALSNRVTALENAGFLTTETDPTVPAWAKASSKPTYTASEVGALPSTTVIPTVPTNVSAFTNDAGYLTSFTETDPTVPSWAKASTKPTYTASEVGALPDTTVIPTTTSQLTNDSGFLTSHQDISGKQDVLTAGDGIAIDNNNTVRTTGIPFGRCDSTSTATVFTATVPGIYKLEDGVCAMIENGVVTSASGFTLNVNGLGAKPCYSNLAAATRDTTLFNVAYTMLFVYDEERVEGGCWVCYRGYDANTNTIGYQVRSNSYSLPASQKFYRYRLLFTSADGTHYVPANTSSSTNATASRTVNQTPIDPFGHIVYYGTTAAVEADARPAASSLWIIYTLSLGYSFNKTGAALTLDDWAPVYLKCAPQTNGSAIIDADTPYVQALPTTNDGKIYIFLGVAYNATSIELLNNHPVYYHDGTGIRLWTGVVPSSGSSGTVTGITMNGGSTINPDANGIVDLGTVITDVSDKQDTLISGTNIKTINSKSILGNGNIITGSKIYVGTCNTQASQSTKVVTTESFPTSGGKPLTGTLIAVLFSNTDTSSSNYTYLNVNSTGAIRIMYGKGNFVAGKNIRYTGISNVYTIYMYNGTYWRWVTTALADVALSGFGYATQNNSSTSSSITATLSDYKQIQGGIVCVKFTYDVPANSTLNINSAGASSIKHKGSNITAGIIKAGDLVTFVYNSGYQILAIDSYYTKAEIDSMIGNIETLLASI